MRYRLGLLFFLFSLIPLILLSAFSAWRTVSTLRQQAISFSQDLLSVTATRIESKVDSLLYASRTLAIDRTAQQLLQDIDTKERDLAMIQQEQALHVRLNSVRVQNPRIRTIMLLTTQGSAIINGVPTSFETGYFRGAFWNSAVYTRVIEGAGAPIWVYGLEGRYERVYLMQRMVNPLSGQVLGILVLGVREASLSQVFHETRGRTGGEMLLVNADGLIFASFPEEYIGGRMDMTGIDSTNPEHGDGFLTLSIDVGTMWTLVHRVPQVFLAEGIQALMYGILVLSVLLVLLAMVLSFILPKMFSEPVEMLLAAMQTSRAGTFLPVNEQRSDEFAKLFEGYNLMVTDLQQQFEKQQQSLVTIEEQKQTIEEYTHHLEGLVQERTRELIESEKMASLGGLVVGVSHEINTPVGTGITSVSIVQEALGEIQARFERDELRRSDMECFFQQANTAIGLALHNLQRASSLVSSFKRVAVNQSHEEPVRFYLQETLHDITCSLQPKISGHAQVVEIDCSFEIELFSFPGVLYQIVANLVSNALQHAYPDRSTAGHICLCAELQTSELLLQCRDDGVGMMPEIAERMFDPFFTTARGSGGTGLGMHIVYNLVTQKLNGRVSVDTAPSQGTNVSVRIPLQEIVPMYSNKR